jgi:hypothetical protein
MICHIARHMVKTEILDKKGKVTQTQELIGNR